MMNIWNRFLQASLGLLLCFAVVQTVYGQSSARVSRYTVATFTGSFNSISSSYTSVGSGDDQVFYAGTLPFAFNFDSTNFASGTSLYIGCNGAMGIGTSTVGACCSNNQGVASYPNNINPHSMDMYIDGTGPGLFYSGALGTYPNRYVILEWASIRAYSGNGNHTSMQVILYETTNKIEMIFKDHSFAFGNSAGGCGLNGGTTYGIQYSTYENSSSTPSSDIRWTPPVPPVPPSQLSLSPKTINFGNVNAGSPVTATITAYSVGTVNLHITGYTLNSVGDYTMITFPKAGDSIVAGRSASYTVQFNPITFGTRNGTFTLVTDGRDSGTQSVAMTGFGSAPLVSYGVTNLFHKVYRRLTDTSAVQYIPVTNIGTGALTFNSVYFIGLNPENYSVSRMPANPLAVGKTDSIGIRFTPKMEGRPDAAVVISSNAANTPWDTVTLFGIGQLARLVVAAATGNGGGYGSSVNLRFDSVALGDSVCQSLSLTNTGSDTLKILRQLVTSSDVDYSFYPLTGPDTMLIPGQVKLVNVCFRPIKAGARIATIRFFTNIPKTFEATPRDTSQFNVNITGVGVPFGRLDVQGRLTDSVLVATKDCITTTLNNTGQTDLVITGATLSGTYSSDYTLTWTGGAPTFTLIPGGSKIVTICFTPGDRGPRPTTLTLTGSTSGQPIVDSFVIAGYGLHICGNPTPSPLYDTVLLGAKDQKTIAVQNCGEVTTFDSASFSATTSQSFAFGSGVSATVLPGNTGNFTVMFSPTTLGASTGMLNFIPSPAIPPVPLYGYGIGVITQGSNNPASAKTGDCVNDTINFPNNGNIDWTPGSPTLSGADAAYFTIVSSTTTATPPGGIVTVILKFCPTNVGQDSVTIDFPSSSPAPYTGTPYAVGATAMPTGSVAERSEQNGFVLGQCYPNPTNATAQVLLSMPVDASVRMDILDATGNVVRNAFAGRLATGAHTLSIDAKGLASGTYYYVVTCGDVRLTRQMVLVK